MANALSERPRAQSRTGEEEEDASTRAPPPWLPFVARARGGDREAFSRLHAAFTRMVHGILLSHVSPADAHDLVQDVFLTAMQKLPTLREDAAFGGWLAQLARSRAQGFHRSRRPVEALPPHLAPSAEAHQEAMEVLEHIRRLPEAYRETLVLRLVEGMTGPEIARETGLTDGSVRVNLHRGMKLLRESLGLEDAHG